MPRSLFWIYVWVSTECTIRASSLLVTDTNLLESRLNSLEALVQQQKQEIETLKSQISKTSSDEVFFSAYLKAHLTPSRNTPTDVVYDGLYLNNHNAYDPKTGKFRAPVKGLYVFSWETMTDAGKIFDTEILVNGARRQINNCNHEGTSAGFSSCTGVVPVQLEVGDVVNIRSTNGNFLHGDWSSFNGWLVHKIA